MIQILIHQKKTGGEKAHILTVNEIPSHYHTIEDRVVFWDIGEGKLDAVKDRIWDSTFQTKGWNAPTTAVGGSAQHNNLQPYITCYIWKRVA